MTIVQQIVDAAHAYSTANDPAATALDAELVVAVDTIVQDIYVVAHDANPTYFSKEVEVDIAAAPADGWTLPVDHVDTLAIDAGAPGGSGVLTAGVEINLVPRNEKDKEFAPRVYRVGQAYHSAGAADDPAQVAGGDKLLLFYSHGHSEVTEIDQTLDLHWPDRHKRLVILRLAHYLSLKDKARGDMEGLNNMIARATQLFMSDVESTDSALKSRYQRSTGTVIQRPQPTN